MARRTFRLALTACGLSALLAVLAPPALAQSDTDDSISPANTPFTFSLAPSTDMLLQVNFGFGSGPSMTITRASSSIPGTTPATGMIISLGNPTFRDCNDSLHGTDKVATNSRSASWVAVFGESLDEANEVIGTFSNDLLNVHIPAGGMTISSSAIPNCTLIIGSEQGNNVLSGFYNDVNTLLLFSPLVFRVSSGCPPSLTSGAVVWVGDYVSTPGFHDVS